MFAIILRKIQRREFSPTKGFVDLSVDKLKVDKLVQVTPFQCSLRGSSALPKKGNFVV